MPSGGTLPYSVAWINNTSQAVLGTGLTYTFNATQAGLFPIKARVTDGAGDAVDSNVVQITVTETPTQRTLSIQSNVTVPVTLDGVQVGNTPVSRQVDEGTHAVSVPRDVTV